MVGKVSFGASLNGIGKQIVENARVIAGCKNSYEHTDSYFKKLNESLSIIRQFRPNDELEFHCKKNDYSSEGSYYVKINDRIIYSFSGDEFKLINAFARDIQRGKVF